jgi:hypothetical protein
MRKSTEEFQANISKLADCIISCSGMSHQQLVQKIATYEDRAKLAEQLYEQLRGDSRDFVSCVNRCVTTPRAQVSAIREALAEITQRREFVDAVHELRGRFTNQSHSNLRGLAGLNELVGV